MSSIAVIATIIILLSVLVCFAFVTQTLAHKREQRTRMISALTAKVRNFKYMQNGFPPGFLPPDLALLVQKSLLEIFNQLMELDPQNTAYQAELQLIGQNMTNVRRQAKPSGPVRLQSQQQISEVKSCLEELHKYIYQLEEKKRLSREDADAHRSFVRAPVGNITVDAYSIAGGHALDRGKLRLAQHNLELAIKLMERERKSGQFDQRIADLQQQHAHVCQQIAQEDAQSSLPMDTSDASALEASWDDEMAQNPDQQWKKKHIYD